MGPDGASPRREIGYTHCMDQKNPEDFYDRLAAYRAQAEYWRERRYLNDQMNDQLKTTSELRVLLSKETIRRLDRRLPAKRSPQS
jgi:hypothetical protein